MKPNNSPSEEWLRLAREARISVPPVPASEPPSAALMAQSLAAFHTAARTRDQKGAEPWFAIPWLGRAATASLTLALACAVFAVSSGALDEFSEPAFPEPEELFLP